MFVRLKYILKYHRDMQIQLQNNFEPNIPSLPCNSSAASLATMSSNFGLWGKGSLTTGAKKKMVICFLWRNKIRIIIYGFNSTKMYYRKKKSKTTYWTSNLVILHMLSSFIWCKKRNYKIVMALMANARPILIEMW